MGGDCPLICPLPLEKWPLAQGLSSTIAHAATSAYRMTICRSQRKFDRSVLQRGWRSWGTFGQGMISRRKSWAATARKYLDKQDIKQLL